MRRLTALATLLLVIASCGEGAVPIDTSTTATPTNTSTSTTEGVASPDPTGEGPQVPGVDCSFLLTMEAVDEALAIWDRPEDEMNTVGHQQGEYCIERISGHEDVFVGIEPGKPGDFAAGAELIGVTGQSVSGVGDEALWFGDVDGVEGVLSVHQSTPLGELHFRIALGRPELDSAAQQEVAKNLALAVLPRFPGVAIGRTEPEVVAFEREPVDRSNASFVDNLLAKEVAGEWTRGEGLVATLGLFAGEVEATQVLSQPELLDNSGTGVIRLAREFLQDGPDTEVRTEIARLLERLFPSRERLEAMPGIGLSTAALGVPAISLNMAQEENECQTYWFGTDSCFSTVAFPELDDVFGRGKYQLLVPEPTTGGWTEQHFHWAVRAIQDSAWIYEGMGDMPDVLLLFTTFGGSGSSASTEAGTCYLDLNRPMQQLEERYFKQRIAAEMAHCMISKTFPAQVGVGYEIVKWWEEGLALWLSTVVYPKADLELKFWPDWLAAIELETTLLDRIMTNWLFFEHTQQFIGWQGNLALAGSMPKKKEGGRAAQEDALAKNEGIKPLLHTFAQGLTDEDIPDSGGGLVPYDVRADTVPISGRTVLLEDPPRFGVVRLHLVVDPDKYACIEYDEGEKELRASWREGEPGTPGDWSDDLPESLQGEAVIVVTTTKTGAKFTVSVTGVGDNPECEDEEDPGTPLEPPPCGLCELWSEFFHSWLAE